MKRLALALYKAMPAKLRDGKTSTRWWRIYPTPMLP